jgi:nucleotide-binding universal stress UspA family protein
MTATIRKILLPVDFSVQSQRAAAYAATLARQVGASIHLMHVVENSTFPRAVDRSTDCDSCRPNLTALAATLHLAADRISIEVRTGSPAETIVDAAADCGCDLVVMATRGCNRQPDLGVGRIAEHVIRGAECPVLVVKESGAARMLGRARIA